MAICEGVGPDALGGGEDELCGARGMVESGVLFRVGFLAAVMEDGGGDGYAEFPMCGGSALHFQEVDGEQDHGAGVADEATLPQRVGGMIFTGSAGGHGPKAIRGSLQDGLGEFEDIGVLDKCQLCVELFFHGVFVFWIIVFRFLISLPAAIACACIVCRLRPAGASGWGVQGSIL